MQQLPPPQQQHHQQQHQGPPLYGGPASQPAQLPPPQGHVPMYRASQTGSHQSSTELILPVAEFSSMLLVSDHS